MTRAVRRRGGRGTLHIISGLLIASAVVRLGAQAGPAMANGTRIDGDVTATVMVAESNDTDALLQAFREREALLAEREALLQDRMQALRLAEVEIAERLEELVTAEQMLAATIAAADNASLTDLEQLTTVYENMKPKEAAALFEEMPPAFAAGFLGMMRPEAAALIMTQLEPETAYSFSVVLAGRNADVPTE